jgi:carbonic anhydrase/acetyltransferase-like protein (isoleucine patch superfamily)
VLSTAIAMIIAAFGVYVLATDAVQRRTKEIALRKLFGTRRRDIGKLVAKEIGTFLNDGHYWGLYSRYQKFGGGEIRTHERVAPLPVFKTGAFNRSATPPYAKIISQSASSRLMASVLPHKEAMPHGRLAAGNRCAITGDLRMIYRLGDRHLQTVGEEFYVAPSADVIGSVRLGRWASVWFGAVLRGDNDWIELGDGTNVQDGSVLHTDAGTPLTVGRNVTIGHRTMLHGCSIGDHCLIGNGAMIMDRVVIGEHSVVAAGAFIPPGKIMPSGVVIMGSPAKVVRELAPKDRILIGHGAEHYIHNARRFRTECAADSRA